ncbi:dihydrofolate reductase [Anaerosporobacter sp.]|uniref:dihydrofolate reductase n=1 Tax=Anaerosporobacter sp. TaxID=1872529 RepID=UPI00286F754C|nr:dihydrofolate reductase [Anaerosporobacter sp.]
MEKSDISLIVARSKNNVIGKEGQIPWKIKGEQKQFKELTIGNAVIMGRKSYDEIGHPLPNRRNIVVSSTANYTGENLVTAKTLQQAIEMAGDSKIFICGGYGLFKEAIPLVSKMYITEIDLEVENGDVFFPDFNVDDFEKVIGEVGGDENPYTRTFYIRKK